MQGVQAPANELVYPAKGNLQMEDDLGLPGANRPPPERYDQVGTTHRFGDW